ncbi:MAG: DUF11 domain-containing protein, partial [Bacteroidales bacterium]|nr:DUF11 domain-containing protein [Bacteroidales bacterium]
MYNIFTRTFFLFCLLLTSDYLLSDNTSFSTPFAKNLGETFAEQLLLLDATDVAQIGITITGPDAENDPVTINSTTTITITVTNAGPHDASGISVEVAIPSGLSFDSSVPNDDSFTIDENIGTWLIPGLVRRTEVNLELTLNVKPAGDYKLTSHITGVVENDNEDNNSTSIILQPVADLGIEMTVSDGPYYVGNQVTFNITATNNGPNDATGVTVTTLLPDGYSYESHTEGASYIPGTGVWTVGNLPSGSGNSQTLNITAKINPTGDYLFEAKVAGVQADLTDTNDSASEEIEPFPVADLGIEMSVSDGPYYVGNQITFSIKATNNGLSNATGVTVTTALPDGYTYLSHTGGTSYNPGTGVWTVGSLNSGGNASMTITATVKPPGNYTFNGSIAGNQNDLSPDNNSTQISVTPQLSDLQITMNASPPNPQIGQVLTFTITIKNIGPDHASGVNVNASIPSGYSNISDISSSGVLIGSTINWNNKSLNDDTSLSLTFKATINSPQQIANEYRIPAQISASNQYDPETSNNTFPQGKITIQSNGSFSFTPALNFNGAVPDITYTVSDGTATDTGILKITVNPVNDAPVANDDYVYTAEGGTKDHNILANDNDQADGQAGGLDTNTLKITQQPSHGTLTILPNKEINYTPYTGFYGNDEAEYEICDLGHPGSLCSRAKIFISVTRRSPIANDDTAETDEDEAVQIDILDNDVDTDLDPTTVVIMVQPQNGTATYLGNGIVEYMPDQDFNGSDFFTYTVTDLTNLTSNVARVDLTIHPVDDAPVATDGLYSTRENQALISSMGERVSDADDNIDWTAISIMTQAANGQVAKGPVAGELTYTPNTNFYGTDAFQFTITDLTNLTSNVATISIQVSDQAPTAVD